MPNDSVGSVTTVVHPDYAAIKFKWEEISDILQGEWRVKERCYHGHKYLPAPDTEPDTSENDKRYRNYVKRAVLYNASSRTVDGMVGQVFSKPPVADFPAAVIYLRDDPSGSGITLEQQAKRVLRDVLSTGRAGLWVDYPPSGEATVAEIQEGYVRPTITSYYAEDILNWRTTMIKSKIIYSFLMLRERCVISDDGYSAYMGYRYRELRLDENGEYKARLFTFDAANRALLTSGWVYPTDSNGDRLREIPFTFVGIHDNDSDVDDPPLYDLCRLNYAHFRNSADYEESVNMVGQPTPWMSGVDQNWVDTIFKGRIYLGSRGGIPLPSGGVAGLLQAAPNSLAKEAMDQKEAQMVALGARLVQEATITKTATEVSNDKVTEVSTLAAAARNTSAAYQLAFTFCSKYSGQSAEIKFELSTDFDMARMSSQEILATMAVWQGKGLTTSEFRDILRRAGYATEALDKAIAQGVAKDPGESAPAPASSSSAPAQNSVDNRVSTSKS